MYMLKSLSVYIVVILLCFSLVACGFLYDSITKTEFDFLHETSRIKSIQIIIIGEITQTTAASSENFKELNTPNFDVICNVQNIEQFMDVFSKVECSISSPPRSPTRGDTGVKILYDNGDYDIICSSGQGEYRDGFYYADSGKVSFDETQFNELINKYINDIR